MLHLSFSEEDIKELDYQRYHHPHPRVQRKMEALLLKAKGLPHQQIASCVGVCENTLRSYLRQYRTGGIEALKRLEFRRPTSDLQAHQDTIEAYFQQHPTTTIVQAVQVIEQLTGLKRSPTQVGIFLKKLGLKRLKTSALPAKCDVEQQATFKKRARAASRASQSRGANGLFRRCGPFRPGSVFGLVVVFHARAAACS